MNAFVKKEIRSLLPAWIGILLLESGVPWFSDQPDVAFAALPYLFFLGMVILGIDSFGREFNSGTFSLLLAQPIERKQIWRTKMKALLYAFGSIFAVYFVSCWLRVHYSHWTWNPHNVRVTTGMFWYLVFQSAIAALIAVTGALWATLLLRQVATAFWIAFLTPMGLATILALLIPAKFASAFDGVFFAVAILYSGFGFWLAQKLFYRAQDAAWTGGVINFSRLRYYESSAALSEARERRPMRALFRKEFQLHSIALIGAGALLALHIVVFFWRALFAQAHKYSTMMAISDFFWVLWLVMPLLIGCMAVAEERKLGVTDEQFCLPVSRRKQFLIKFLPTMFFGIVMGGIMPLLLEGIAAHFGLRNEIFTRETHPTTFAVDPLLWFKICVISLSAGFALAAFFGSTLARNFLQALSITIVTVIGSWLFVAQVIWINHEHPIFFGITLWHSYLPVLISVVVVPAALIWLAYLNFNHFQESKRLWRRNVIGIAGALLFVMMSSAAIYNRAWEMFEPAEPPHGAAKLSITEPPKLSFGIWGSLLVRFPDGRIWYDNLENIWMDNQSFWQRLTMTLIHPLPKTVGPERFVGGDSSHWVWASAARIQFSKNSSGYFDTVGIKDDGTLWISEKVDAKTWSGDKMIRFGDTTGWKQGVQIHHGFLLLKNDGTLWYWGNGTNRFEWDRKKWPTVRIFQPKQIETEANWAEICPIYWMSAVKKLDGTVWRIDEFKNSTNQLYRETNWDNVNLQTFSQNGLTSAYISTNGTLWVCNAYWKNNIWNDNGYLQVGSNSNWRAVSAQPGIVIALKSDGTLWQWKFPFNSPADAAKIPPRRLGIHSDWVDLTSAWGDTVSLAADGSLWFWPLAWDYDYSGSSGALMKPPKQPEFLGNVFGKGN